MTYNIGELSPMKRHWISKSSNIPTRFWGFEPSDIVRDKGSFPEDIHDWIKTLQDGLCIKHPGGLGTTGRGLLFDGKPGMGKTTHAVTTLMEVVRNLPDDDTECRKLLHYSMQDYSLNARPVYYLTMTDLLWKKKSAWDAEGEEQKRLVSEMEGFHGRSRDDRLNVRVLVLDDLGKEYGSEYDKFSFDEILRSRYDQGLPTIITTNTPRENWKTKYGEVMASFAFEAFKRVALTGTDLRA
jgi:DNA replication protein DnaC